MMEQAHAGEGHGDAVLVGGGDDVVITDRAAGLGNVLHAALAGAFHVVAEGEERIAAHSHAGLQYLPLRFPLFLPLFQKEPCFL